MTVSIRLLDAEDAAALAGLRDRNREHLGPWEPTRPDDWFTLQGQRQEVGRLLEAHAAGHALPMAVIDGEGALVGQVMLDSIIRGAFQSASLAYWISEDHLGHGYATRAVALLVDRAFTELRLRRVQAEVLPRNVASLRVLERSGFTRYGFAPAYLRIAGRWQDHVLLQRVDEPRSGSSER